MINIKDEKYLKAFGEHLKEMRTANNLSQEELAFRSNISANQIGRIERGEINPTISTLKTIADAIGIHPKDMLEY